MNDISEAPHDADTGELFLTTSEAAEQARRAAAVKAPVAGMELFAALALAVADLPVWVKQNEEANVTANRRMKYANLKAILMTVRPVLLKHGIRIRQGAAPSWTLDGGGIKGRLVPVYTDLIHSETGQIDRTIIEIPVTKLDAQAMGSALTYGRRYSLLAALGLTTDEADDDGKATRSKSLNDQHEESQTLWLMKEELRAIDDPAKLKQWADKMDSTRRADDLDEGEQMLLHQAFNERRREIADAKTEKAKK